MTSWLALSSLSRKQSRTPGSVSSWAFLLFGSVLGIIEAFLLVLGRWQIAFGLALILPAAILLFRFPILAVILWLFLDPFLMTASTTSGRMVYWMIHRALPPLTLGTLGIGYLTRIRKFPKLGLAELAMIGYVGASLFSIASLNPTPQETAYEFYDRVISPMCIYFMIRLSEPGEKEIKQLTPAVFFIGLTQALIGTLSWLAPHLLPGQWLHLEGERTTGTIGSYSTYSSTMIFVGVFLLHAALNRKPGLIRVSYLGIFFLSIFCVFISFSRASWLAGILVLLGLVYLYPKFMLPWILVTLPLILFVVGVLFAGHFYDPSQRLNESQTALSRLPVVVAAVNMFEEKPIFGWGYGNFDYYDRFYQERVADLVSPSRKDLTSHDFYLTILAEQGLVGLILFLAPPILWLFETIRTRRRVPRIGSWSRNLLFLLWLVILAHFIENNFSPMWNGFGFGMWWLTLGLIANMISGSATNNGWNFSRTI